MQRFYTTSPASDPPPSGTATSKPTPGRGGHQHPPVPAPPPHPGPGRGRRRAGRLRWRLARTDGGRSGRSFFSRSSRFATRRRTATRPAQIGAASPCGSDQARSHGWLRRSMCQITLTGFDPRGTSRRVCRSRRPYLASYGPSSCSRAVTSLVTKAGGSGWSTGKCSDPFVAS
jgi:hypothetical protein